MNITTLSEQLGIELNLLLTKCSQINLEHDLNIKDFARMNRTQYDILRSVFDTAYLVSIFKGDKRGAKYNYTSSINYKDVENWIIDQSLNGLSSKEVKELLPDHLKPIGPQSLASAMKSNGYYSKVITKDDGKQGRRWFNNSMQKVEPSFI